MKFTIVTPSYNNQRFIGETIESVINQKGHFSIEYIIVDNCSTDQTQQIVEKYITLLESNNFVIKCNKITVEFISEHDSNMYEAIQAGFTNASGDIFAWLNSDDIYLPGAFDIIQKTFSKYQHIRWLKGITSYLNESSNIFSAGKCHLYYQNWIAQGLYGPILHFIQQDSVFWRSELWRLSGGVDPSYHAAGDFSLWRKFAQNTPLWSLNSFISCFRKVSGQKSEDIASYWREVNDYKQIQNNYKTIAKWFQLKRKIPTFMRPLCIRLIAGRQQYQIVTLENNFEPYLREGSYYELKKLL